FDAKISSTFIQSKLLSVKRDNSTGINTNETSELVQKIHSNELSSTVNISSCSKDFNNWLESNNVSQHSPEIDVYIKTNCGEAIECNKTSLIGPLAVLQQEISLEWLYENELKFVKKGGWWQPEDCKPRQSTLIVIPFRNRELQLPILLRQLHPILKRQNLHYRIMVVEQNDQDKFNRAKLLNIGFDQGLKLFPYQCIIIHDVDLLPENDKIDYGCKTSPTHLSVGVNIFRYILPYKEIFGGVSSMLSSHFRKINGATNLFYGWGGEDDNIYWRLRMNGFNVHRQSIKTARYTMMNHPRNGYTKRDIEAQQKLNYKLWNSTKFWKDDGLNSLQYGLISVEEKQLYTHVKVDLQMDKENFLF
ncbi:beta-1,4-N-acetylgalactosaminyltransferase bre-4-like, partial [Clytia hemisphaerica]|uniref:beta-1,4-N-acetylgalactosaminyltransferase bre-4-like n=1 Tax=Clytia hemisphaerica TaxID=252671 RepID=UPI0034D6B09B